MAAVMAQRLGPQTDMVYRIEDEKVTLGHLHTHALPLGVFCRHCNHRALILGDQIGAREGSMASLFGFRFRCKSCQRRGTGQDHFWLYLFHRQSEADDFIVQEQTREI